MATGTYAKSHHAWEDHFHQGGQDKSSLMQLIFGSCSGVVDAASTIFTPDRGCPASPSKVRRGSKSRRSKSPSLRKSEELLEIPEFLSAELQEHEGARQSPTDDISALSSYTLEEMARHQKLVEMRGSQSRRMHGAGPPSPTTTDVSEDLPVPGSSYLRTDMTIAPLSGMVVSNPRKETIATAGDISMSSLGSKSSRFA